MPFGFHMNKKDMPFRIKSSIVFTSKNGKENRNYVWGIEVAHHSIIT